HDKIYSLSLHDALPILADRPWKSRATGMAPLIPAPTTAPCSTNLPRRGTAGQTRAGPGLKLASTRVSRPTCPFSLLSIFLNRMRSEEHTSELQSRENLV